VKRGKSCVETLNLAKNMIGWKFDGDIKSLSLLHTPNESNSQLLADMLAEDSRLRSVVD
jgi:hypothetical protein